LISFYVSLLRQSRCGQLLTHHHHLRLERSIVQEDEQSKDAFGPDADSAAVVNITWHWWKGVSILFVCICLAQKTIV